MGLKLRPAYDLCARRNPRALLPDIAHAGSTGRGSRQAGQPLSLDHQTKQTLMLKHPLNLVARLHIRADQHGCHLSASMRVIAFALVKGDRQQPA